MKNTLESKIQNRKLKNWLRLALLCFPLFALPLSAFSQTFGGGIAISGTTNAMLQSNGSVITNSFYLSVPAKTVVLSGISNTNEVSIFSYGLAVAGSTNIWIVASITNTYTLAQGGTNQSGTGTWSTNLPAQTIQVQLVPWAQANIGATNNNNIYVP